MAPHWKCGSAKAVAGSNPALSAIRRLIERPPRYVIFQEGLSGTKAHCEVAQPSERLRFRPSWLIAAINDAEKGDDPCGTVGGRC
jgi:hypothetical protein